MLKFIWGKGNQPNTERVKQQKELFAFQKTVHHGFPNKPTSTAFDPELKLLAIGTKHGELRVYGKPGVEFYGAHSHETPVSKILFLPGQGRLVTLTEDNNELHLWEINGTNLQEKKNAGLEGRLKRISCLELDSNKRILVGTEGGNIYILNLRKFVFDDHIIYQDLVIGNCNNDAFKVNPGAAESILTHPSEPDKILIGYARGLIALWDRASGSAVNSYVANQQLECLAWRNDGSEFISCHNDGSYIVWSATNVGGDGKPLEPPAMPYGPYPCKAITRFEWVHQSGSAWMVFSGGMPRASYADKNTVTVMQSDSDEHVVFDLSTKIIDFILVASESERSPQCLLILAEEELVAIDLTSKEFPVYPSPYLNSIHASAVTCINQVSGVSEELFRRLKDSSDAAKFSRRPWPISGGVYGEQPASKSRDLLITGHEDGSVKFWSAGSVALSLLTVLKTGKFFRIDDDEVDNGEDEEEEEEWPPFKKVGSFDPYSDDPRMAIKKVIMCEESGRVFVGGTGGQVIMCDLAEDPAEKPIQIIKSDLVTEKEGFTWKGHSSLIVRTNDIKLTKGYQPSLILQINPPASINSLGFHGQWQVMAAGTAHGLVMLDCVTKAAVATKCTLNAQDIANADDNPMSRRKSLKKSLRESFRRLRKGRSQRNIDKKKIGGGTTTTEPIKKDPRSDSPDSRPVERQVEARSGSEDGLGSMVRCLHFANTYIANSHTISPTLWAGTNSGQVLIFMLTIPKARQGDKKETTSALLAKEIQLKHRAPVINVQVLDSSGLPVDDSETGVPHRVLITSEEQFKIFLLPTLKPCGKYKLTAHEGARIRKVGFTSFVSKSDESTSENCFVCLTNLGDITVHSLPELRRQMQTPCIKKEDVMGVSTFVFTPGGEAFYLSSFSEIQRVSMAATKFLIPSGTLSLPSGARMEAPASPPSVVAASASVKSPADGSDLHNETTVSEISADITVDSVKDHTVISQAMETSLNETRSEISKTVTKTTSSFTKVGTIDVDLPLKTEVNDIKMNIEDVNGALAESLNNSVVIEDHLTTNTFTTTTTNTTSQVEKSEVIENTES